MLNRNVLSIIFLIAALTGCSSLPQLETQQAAPLGVHLLTEVTVRLTSPNSVAYGGYAYAGGTETCESLSVFVEWPDELKNHIKQEGSLVDPSRLAPGQWGTITKEVTFDPAHVTLPQIERLVPMTPLTFQCDPGEQRWQVLPRLKNTAAD